MHPCPHQQIKHRASGCPRWLSIVAAALNLVFFTQYIGKTMVSGIIMLFANFIYNPLCFFFRMNGENLTDKTGFFLYNFRIGSLEYHFYWFRHLYLSFQSFYNSVLIFLSLCKTFWYTISNEMKKFRKDGLIL